MMKENKTMRTITMIIILIVMSFLMSSCVGSIGGREINRIGIVTSIAVDYEDEKIIVTLEIVNPVSSGSSGGGGGGNSPGPQNFIYLEGKGDTVNEAIINVNTHFDKKIFLSHSNLLIIGEDLAKRGITDLMDYFIRDNEPREDMYLVVAKGAKAYDIIGVRPDIGKGSRNYLYDILNNFPYNPQNINISLAEQYRNYYDVSNEPVIGLVQRKEEKQLSKEEQNKGTTKTVLDVSGGAVLSRDYLIGYFTGEEMIGYNFIVDRVRTGTIVFRTPIDNDEKNIIIGKDGRFTSVDVTKTKTKNKISVDNGKIHLTVDVDIRGVLSEINQALEVSNPKVISRIEKACSEKIKELVSATLDKGQKEFKQDNFSIGVVVHQQYPELWKEIGKDWKEIFPEISYDVNVKTTLIQEGLINTPANLRKRR